ncbi:MAG: hypothetical protein JSV99_02450 [Planctomycetota bacterium]|nr:MAG: hypothetical protein JSV99_02450 [Planctomycetota bacterium]
MNRSTEERKLMQQQLDSAHLAIVQQNTKTHENLKKMNEKADKILDKF